MNNKGEVDVGQMFLLAVGLILVAVFAVSIATQQSPLTTTQSVSNQTVTFPSVNSTLTLNGQAVVGSVVATNASGGELISSGNYSTTDFVQVGGQYRTILTLLDAGVAYAGESVNLSYAYEPVGYNQDSGSRGIAGLPLLFWVIGGLAFAFLGVKEWIEKSK